MKVVIVFVLLLIIAALVVALSRVWRKGKKQGMTHIPPLGAHPIRVPREDYDKLMADEPEDVEDAMNAEEDIMRRRRLHAASLGKDSVGTTSAERPSEHGLGLFQHDARRWVDKDTDPPTEAWSMTDPFRPLDSRNSRTCPVCSAGPEQVCHTLTTHKPTKMHAARTKG